MCMYMQLTVSITWKPSKYMYVEQTTVIVCETIHTNTSFLFDNSVDEAMQVGHGTPKV